jgi:hypothetical protein
VPPGHYELVLNVDGKSYRQKLRVVADPRVHIAQADFAAQFDLSQRIIALMNQSAVWFSGLASLETQVAQQIKSLPSTAPKELAASLEEAQKEIDKLENGSEEAPGFGTLNRNLGRYLVMVQGGDIAPTESVQTAFRSSCEAYVKDATSAHKLTDDILPVLNKLGTPQNLVGPTYEKPISATAVCAPEN